ncbi:MAG: hypothetical protein OXE17_03560 [Chloroflexi bacterium]|nr:hypothetical protein [Chloroflexota bacterium]
MLSNLRRSNVPAAARLVICRLVLFPALIALLLALTACFSPGAGNDDIPDLGGPQYSALMVSSDLAKGSNRLIFALVDRNNVPVSADTATVVPMYSPPGGADPELKEAITAHFLSWPPEGSGRGVFVAEIEFDIAGDATRQHPGLWELKVSATDSDGDSVEATTAVRVAAIPATPGIGTPAPRSVTPTLDQVDDLAEISSDPNPDPGFYQLSVAEALDEEVPLVVLFSTPAFCVSATCGPQLEVLQNLKERYDGKANFIHVEVFEDPHLIEGNRFAAKKVPAVDEWGLPSEPWTFVVDQDGLVQAKFEQFTPESLLDETLSRLLGI